MKAKDIFIREDFVFILQWHLTNRCDFRCNHCYIPNEKKKAEEELTFEQITPTIDELSDLVSRWGVRGKIHYTGGNPLLRQDIFDIINYTIDKNIEFGILGNPTASIDELRQLKKLGITKYQISLDGFKENHDYIRGQRAFDKAINFLKVLKENDIFPDVMSTVTKRNINEIPELAKYLYENKLVKRFDFARLVPIGQGQTLETTHISAQEYRNFMYKMLDTYKELKSNNVKYKIGAKDPLWSLVLYELGESTHDHRKDLICGGCGVGISGLTIDVDGTVQSCRRLNDNIGNIKNQSLWEIFFNSNKLNQMRNQYSIEKCNTCDIISACRGCRAVANGVNGNYFAEDPQCWYNI
ncbi:radical SAM protein [Candidatus Woesearchaeota archaeon]|nr:radical SAM protein [Candidatus Woesearchaeota archaeon]